MEKTKHYLSMLKFQSLRFFLVISIPVLTFHEMTTRNRPEMRLLYLQHIEIDPQQNYCAFRIRENLFHLLNIFLPLKLICSKGNTSQFPHSAIHFSMQVETVV